MGFLEAIADALELQPRELARLLGVRHAEVIRLWKLPANQLVEINRDPMWASLTAYLDMRHAKLLAVRQVLNIKLAKDRKQQIAHRLMIENRR